MIFKLKQIIKHSSLLEKIIGLVLAIIIIIIITGTVYAFFSGSRDKKLVKLSMPAKSEQSTVYDGVGRIRAKTKDAVPAVVVVNMAFYYDASDRQFSEELYRKRVDMRNEAIAFFESQSTSNLSSQHEAVIKAALRDKLNSLLSLGQIAELFFSEFTVVK